jgi:protein transport protein SEC23
MKSCFE